MNQTDLESELRNLIVHELGAADTDIHSDTSLFHDLGTDGMDGEQFMEAYARRFDVDLANFEFSLHFGPEAAFNPLLYIYWRLFTPHRLRFIPITFAHLTQCALTHRWTTASEPARASFESAR